MNAEGKISDSFFILLLKLYAICDKFSEKENKFYHEFLILLVNNKKCLDFILERMENKFFEILVLRKKFEKKYCLDDKLKLINIRGGIKNKNICNENKAFFNNNW